MLVDVDLAGDHRLLVGDGLLAAHRDADRLLLEGVLARPERPVANVLAPDVDFLALEIDRDGLLLLGDRLMELHLALLGRALLDVEALLAHRHLDVVGLAGSDIRVVVSLSVRAPAHE